MTRGEKVRLWTSALSYLVRGLAISGPQWWSWSKYICSCSSSSWVAFVVEVRRPSLLSSSLGRLGLGGRLFSSAAQLLTLLVNQVMPSLIIPRGHAAKREALEFWFDNCSFHFYQRFKQEVGMRPSEQPNASGPRQKWDRLDGIKLLVREDCNVI